MNVNRRRLGITSALVCALALCVVGEASAQEAPAPRSSGTRIAVQARLDAFNMFGASDALVTGGDAGGLVALSGLAPTATAGVRLDRRLFLGMGLGLLGSSVTTCSNDGCEVESTTSNSGFTLSPLATFDVLNDRFGALYLLGWLNLGSVGGGTTEITNPMGTTTFENDGFFMWGMNLGAGVRGELNEALAMGAEFGWGFLNWDGGDAEDDQSVFLHGFFGTLTVEASVGL